MSFNKVIFMGNLTRDPEERTTKSGTNVVGFAIAVNSGWGESQSTMFVNCSVWGKRGETVAKYFKKGSPILVTGELSQREWEDKEGKTRTNLEVNVDDFSFVGGKDDNQTSAPAGKSDTKIDTTEISDDPIDIDDIPF